MFIKIIGASLAMLVIAPMSAPAQPDPGREQQKQGDEVLGAVVGGVPAPGYGLPGIARMDTREREVRLEARINARLSDGSLAQDSASRDLRRLDEVRHMDAAYRDGNADGGLSPDQYADIDQRLDSLRRELAIVTPPALPY